jgi:Uma2 family endonuclease
MTSATTSKPKLMTAEEFYDWANRPENENKWFELVRGEVLRLPSPRMPHGVVAGNAVWILNGYVRQRRKGYVASNDSGVILERDPDTVRGPDVALYEGVHSFDELPAKYAENPPRLAVEVLSPSDRADRILHKITDYLRNGVDLVWLIDPRARTVTVYRPDQGPRVYTENEELSGEDVLPGFRCRVADFFYLPEQEPEQKATPNRRRRRS